METITLGRTGLRVSRIAYGTWQLGGEWGTFDEDAAVAAIGHARELGVNFFDAAQAYGFGAAEELLGRALRPVLRADRDSVVIATKGGVREGGGRDASPDALRRGVESSLRALGVEHIDLYQVHWPDPRVPQEETAGALRDLVDEGKIRHVGVSNYDVPEMEAFARVRPVETLQPPYHLFRRGIEAAVLPYTRAHDIGVLAYSPLASGLLTGRIDEDTTFAPDDWRSASSAFTGDALKKNLEVVRRLERFAAERGIGIGQLAVAWVLAQEGVHAAIVGARSARHIADSAAAAEIRLTPADLSEIDRLTADAVPIEGASPEGVA